MANRNGYVTIYLPEHHRADSTGMVYEHIVNAEFKIQRKLIEGEVVHHIDENRSNNNYNNLMVFDNDASHIRFHAGFNSRELGNGSFTCDEKFNNCRHCNNITSYKNEFCSVKCATIVNSILNRKVNRPTKEDLVLNLKENNFVIVGNLYGVSDNTIRKWCRYYNISDKAKDYK